MNFFEKIWNWIDTTLKGIGLDGFVLNMYEKYVVGIHELFKILIMILFVIIVILGVISFVKKMTKLFITLAIIVIGIIFLSKK